MNRYDIGRRIEAYREKLNMSTQELAGRIKRSQATISRIENGKQGLTFELLSAVAAELRVHPFALLSDETPRAPVLLPARERPGRAVAEGYSPSLLSNALHGGRLRRNLRMDAAAEMLGLARADLEAVELAQAEPDDELLARLCSLYGLPRHEMETLRRFAADAPGTAKSLAHLQRICSHIRHMIRNGTEGEERRTLDRILELLESADAEHPMEPEASPDEVGLFLNRLSLHLVNALRDSDFRGKMLQLAERDPSAPRRDAPPPETRSRFRSSERSG